MVRIENVEYPALLSTVDCGGIVGFILTLKGQVFSLILYSRPQILHEVEPLERGPDRRFRR
jgi:hypothetical protein